MKRSKPSSKIVRERDAHRDAHRDVIQQRHVFATMRRLRPKAELAVGAVSISGGLALLLTNISSGAALSVSMGWVPVSANLALIGGGLMFVREFIRHRHEPPANAR